MPMKGERMCLTFLKNRKTENSFMPDTRKNFVCPFFAAPDSAKKTISFVGKVWYTYNEYVCEFDKNDLGKKAYR